MIDILKIPATIQEIYNDPAKERSAFLKLEIVPGEVFQIDDSMLEILCEELLRFWHKIASTARSYSGKIFTYTKGICKTKCPARKGLAIC